MRSAPRLAAMAGANELLAKDGPIEGLLAEAREAPTRDSMSSRSGVHGPPRLVRGRTAVRRVQRVEPLPMATVRLAKPHANMPPATAGGATVAGACSISTMGDVEPRSNGHGSKFTGRSLGLARAGRLVHQTGHELSTWPRSESCSTRQTRGTLRHLGSSPLGVHRLSAPFLRELHRILLAIEIKRSLVPSWLRNGTQPSDTSTQGDGSRRESRSAR